MVTFQAAREAVAIYAQRIFPPDAGTFYVAPWGREDATHFQVIAGSRERLVDGRTDAAIMDWPVFLVNRATGQVEPHPYLAVMDRLESMAEVGERE